MNPSPKTLTGPELENAPRRLASLWADYSELVKLRLSTLVVFTALAGFYLGSFGSLDWVLLLHLLGGTALLAFSAAALNQVLETEADARMERTANRPLPAGRLSADEALLFGFIIAIAGLLWLAFSVNLLTATLGAFTLGSYVFVYTPLKKVTTLNTLVGAIPGALPPVMGWTAATGRFSLGALILFAILFFWQLPHFLAISWLYRDDYARGGFAMLSGRDASGHLSGRQSLLYAVGLVPISLLALTSGMSTAWAFPFVLLAGLAYAFLSARFAFRPSRASALVLFIASIAYLPLTLGALVLFKP